MEFWKIKGKNASFQKRVKIGKEWKKGTKKNWENAKKSGKRGKVANRGNVAKKKKWDKERKTNKSS